MMSAPPSQVLERRNRQLQQIIRNTRIDPSYIYSSGQLLDEKIRFLAEHCQNILDFGKSSRHRFEMFTKDQVMTCDIKQFEDYPDIIDDICDSWWVLKTTENHINKM